MRNTRITSFARPITFPFLSTFNGPSTFNVAATYNTHMNVNGAINANGGVNIPTAESTGFLQMDIAVVSDASIMIDTASVALTMNNRAGIIKLTDCSLAAAGQGFRVQLTNSYVTTSDLMLVQLLYHESYAVGAANSGVPLAVSWQADAKYINVALPANGATFTNKEVWLGFMVINYSS